jgi:AraC-like DNA-binding protein
MLDQVQNFLSIFVGLLGFFVILLLLFSNKSNRNTNNYLFIVFLLVSIRQIHSGLLFFYASFFSHLDLLVVKPFFLLGVPSFYLYFESLFSDKAYFNKKHLTHFIIPISFFIFRFIQLSFFGGSNQIPKVIIVYSILFYVLFYTALTSKLIYKNLHKTKDNLDSFNDIHFSLIKKWSMYLFVVGSLLVIRLIYSVVFEIKKEEGEVLGYSFQWLTNILWISVFLKVLSSPGILFGFPKLKNHVFNGTVKRIELSSMWNLSQSLISNVQDSKLTVTIETKVQPYLIDIESHIFKINPFRLNKYALTDLAKDLCIPVSHLAYIFKYHCKVPFVEFRKFSRINDALNLIKEGFLVNKTFEALAEKVGFNSYNSFYISFKKYTGASPSEYV